MPGSTGTMYIKVVPSYLTPDEARDEIVDLLYNGGVPYEDAHFLAGRITDHLKVVTIEPADVG
ncbi:hypothetical protein FGG51_gp073 [Mycobacterium phage Astro]|uniref:Uncharacterized protein n=2 Tax=Fromanvirus astro TaxID=1195075 RepID=I6S7A6_9CAUD|nr:hypothetical protein AVT31_gp074 [Mycobacterium phage Smeadley]YP_009638491.1 hypothetical protein FGG51_gp073 [Mycobacterium phage Astro]AXQ63539.1 hypothetical protein SEA_DIXON_33 [Mycobacterium phage Dixon]AYD86962.1 hypothetical protein SEA_NEARLYHEADLESS_33 [Mycobacterium phage NearlyHeadless]WNO26719.1 hypothetical protein SEA_GROUNDHOG_32 [Mycobacterium phage Groundhog]AFM54925.1 hypothetical protein ASTRO_33 [Mycobacterium phage Astro]AKQ07601.1 hypothetical protein SEA_SMEADLEY_3